MLHHPSQDLMLQAIQEAKNTARQGQLAIGALVVDAEGKILSIAHTTTHSDHDPSAHAEMNAIRAACKKVGSRYLEGCWLYSTLEPCPMCCSAAIWAKLVGVVYGTTQDEASWVARNAESGNYTWRCISLSAHDVMTKGDPNIRLIPDFLKAECEESLSHHYPK